MKVQSETKKPRIQIEKLRHKPGFARIRFYENERTVPQVGELSPLYEYDVYDLELPDSGGLEKDIPKNYAVYLLAAKSRSECLTWEKLEKKLRALESVNAAQDEALIELYERTEEA